MLLANTNAILLYIWTNRDKVVSVRYSWSFTALYLLVAPPSEETWTSQLIGQSTFMFAYTSNIISTSIRETCSPVTELLGTNKMNTGRKMSTEAFQLGRNLQHLHNINRPNRILKLLSWCFRNANIIFSFLCSQVCPMDEWKDFTKTAIFAENKWKYKGVQVSFSNCTDVCENMLDSIHHNS